MVMLVSREGLETPGSVENQDLRVSRVPLVRLEFRVLVAGMELSVKEVSLVPLESLASLEELGRQEMLESMVNKVLLETQEPQDSLVNQVILVLLECRDHQELKVCIWFEQQVGPLNYHIGKT